ncbi:WXG100 family type VII secretion target [Kitasatospora sp. NPDC004614]|uniref:WXG100 family type VII secretion target n=1 Tax=unclassified Kitasatospora TaxID=2633591 RepID=UPI00367853B5
MMQGRFIREIHDDGGEIDGASHEQLVAMVQHTDPIAVMQVAQRLLAAANKMDEVSEELHAHMSGLDWEGAAADSFKNWGSQVSKSTMDLASYSRNAGEYMASAGETLATVKSGMPAVPHADMQTVSRYDDQPNDAVSTGGAILGGMIPGVGAGIGSWAAGKIADAVDSDWVTPDEAKAAQQRVNQAHNEAVQQMNKLAQAYQQSTMQLNSVQPPVFPPLPGGGGEHGDGSVDVPIDGGGGSTGRNPGGGSTLPHPPRVAPPPAPRPPQPPTPGPPNPPQPPIPGPPHPPQPPTPNPPHPPVPVPPNPPTPTPWPPIKDPGTGLDHTPPPAPTPPGPTGPGHGGGGGGIGGGGLGDVGGGSSGGGRGGGYPGGPIGGGPIGGGLGGGGATGTGRTGGGGAPGTGGRAGGTTTTSGGAGQAGQAGRAGTSGMGGMPHSGGGMGAGGAKGGAGGARGGGLVSRGGGTVGGQRGSTSGRDVTPGGTGLRGRAERGADGRAGQGGFGGGHGGANRKGKPQGKRPDYLTEDEDTWTSGMGPVNPNVIE